MPMADKIKIPEIELQKHPVTGKLVQEEWRIVSEFENYKVSNYCRFLSIERDEVYYSWGKPIPRKRKRKEMLRKPYKDRATGYVMINLYKNGIDTNMLAHRIVAEHFVNNDGYPCVNHKDLNKDNNFFLNLEWVTYSENASHERFNRGKTSRYTGVSYSTREQTWSASCSSNGKKIYLGKFPTEEAAHDAYVAFTGKAGIVNRYADKSLMANFTVSL